MRYEKLIRDHIPEIIAAAGKRAEVEVMDDNDFRLALLQKLVEEASEARNAAPAELAIELADLLEVLDAVFEAFGISQDEVRTVQARLREQRGGFTQQLRLLSVSG